MIFPRCRRLSEDRQTDQKLQGRCWSKQGNGFLAGGGETNFYEFGDNRLIKEAGVECKY